MGCNADRAAHRAAAETPAAAHQRQGGLKTVAAAALCALAACAAAQGSDAARQQALAADVQTRLQALQPKMVAWRRDIHEHPELSGQEARTARRVAEHLRALGLEVRTGVGGHGVVGVLRGAQPGKVVALRADMDALPVLEATGLPFASKATMKNMGRDSPVAHACGHDGHTAILMGVAELLAGMRAQIPGSVVFVFQPAEEGRSEVPADPAAPIGARAMVVDGALDNPKVQAMFGLHISPAFPVGTIGYRSGALMAGSDGLKIKVTGRQTHGAFPWAGVDPIVVSAQIVGALQTVVSRQLDISKEPAVLSIGAINGGNRGNIVPDSVEMLGTLRTFDDEMRSDAKKRITTISESLAAASGAKAEVQFDLPGNAPTVNPAALTDASLPMLRAATGNNVLVIPKIAGSEDYSEFQKAVPAFFFMLGATPKGKTAANAPPNHSPLFDFDEDALAVGARILATLALDNLAQP